MDNETIVIFVGLFSIITQCTTIFFVLRIIKELGPCILWRFLGMAFSLMVLRRATALLITLGWYEPAQNVVFIFDRVLLPSLISLLILTGVYSYWKTAKTLLNNPKE